MAEKKRCHIEDKRTDPFAEYFISGEPCRADKAYAWQTAIGLQDVDKLQPSEYLLNTDEEQPIKSPLSLLEITACRRFSKQEQYHREQRQT